MRDFDNSGSILKQQSHAIGTLNDSRHFLQAFMNTMPGHVGVPDSEYTTRGRCYIPLISMRSGWSTVRE